MLPVKLRQERPAGAAAGELVITSAMANPDDLAGSGAQHRRQLIDAGDHAVQIVLRRPGEKPKLHVDNDHCIHRQSPSSEFLSSIVYHFE